VFCGVEGERKNRLVTGKGKDSSVFKDKIFKIHYLSIEGIYFQQVGAG
jgi:hypothetical protein